MTEPRSFQAIRERLARATAGPWAVPAANVFRVIAPEAAHSNRGKGMTPAYPWRVICDMGDPDGMAADATFIAYAPTDIADLLAEVDHQAAEIERLRDLADALAFPVEDSP